MEIVQKVLTDAYVLKPRLIPDDRGFFFESYNAKLFEEIVGKEISFK